MTYNITTVYDLAFSKQENEFYYDGIVTIADTIGEAKCSACYHEPAFGLPYLTLLKTKNDFDPWDETPELDVVLRSGYAPVYKKGKRGYGKFLDESGDKVIGDFARAAHSKNSDDILPICDNLSQNLKRYLETNNYKIVWNPQEIDNGRVDGSIAVGMDSQRENPRIILYYRMLKKRLIQGIYLYGKTATYYEGMGLYKPDIGLINIDYLTHEHMLNLNDETIDKLDSKICTWSFPAREEYEAKRIVKGLPPEPWEIYPGETTEEP